MRVDKHLQVKTKLSSVNNYSFLLLVSLFVYIGTHNIQDVISSIDVDKFCFQFQYVNGSIANKTHLQFVPANGNQITYNYATWQLDKLNCIMLPANNWTLYACEELPCTLNPAVTVTDIVISALSTSLSISSDSIHALSSISLVSSIFLTTKESSFTNDISMDVLCLLNICSYIVSGSIITTPSASPSSGLADSVVIGIVIAVILMFFVILISCKLQYPGSGQITH